MKFLTETRFSGLVASMGRTHLVVLQLLTSSVVRAVVSITSDVPLYRTFETAIDNSNTTVANRFSDVWLNTTFTSPDGERTEFFGFYDGANTWRLRFMPNAVGHWSYSWRFSDGSLSGRGGFTCVAAGASPGVLRPYAKNPRWFSYNGNKPVFIKSYYNKAGGSVRQSASWFDKHFYSKLAARGVVSHALLTHFLTRSCVCLSVPFPRIIT